MSIPKQFPSLPALLWDGYRWSGTLALEAWRGFGTWWRDNYYEASGYEPSANVALSIVVEEDRQPPAPEQAAAVQHLIDNQWQVRNSFLRACFDLYPQWQQYDWGDRYGLQQHEYMPGLEQPDDLIKLLGWPSVYVHWVNREHISYLGFVFNPTWEAEHGMSIVMHRERVVDLEPATGEIASALWVAQADVDAAPGHLPLDWRWLRGNAAP